VRRSKGHAQSVITVGDIAVNLDTRTVSVAGQPANLTGKEFQMMELLALRQGVTLSKEMFLNHLYGGRDEPEAKIIDVFVCKLRKKLPPDTIATVWGRGYLFGERGESLAPEIAAMAGTDYAKADAFVVGNGRVVRGRAV
jgi:two-component system cell cycle response regulator CtrA